MWAVLQAVSRPALSSTFFPISAPSFDACVEHAFALLLACVEQIFGLSRLFSTDVLQFAGVSRAPSLRA